MPRGRFRTFDTDAALGRALDLFWRQGYQGTSIAQLTEVMGISPPSLYSAYGNKRQLFDLVVERYGELRGEYMQDVLGQPTAYLAAERFLVGAAENASRPDEPLGCLLVGGGLASSPGDDGVAEMLAGQRDANQAAIEQRFERGVREGDLPPGADTTALARYVATVWQGMAVQASGGASYEELLVVARLALASFSVLAAGGGHLKRSGVSDG